MEELPYIQKMKLARELLLDPQTGRAAAYTTNHQLVVELASKRLVNYALAHTESEEAFDRGLHAKGAPRCRPLPAWATEDVLDRLRLARVNWPNADAPDKEWREIPKR